MIALPMVMRDIIAYGASEVVFAERDDPIQALFFDRSHKALRVGVRVRRSIRGLHDPKPRVFEQRSHRTPFGIAIADQQAVRS